MDDASGSATTTRRAVLVGGAAVIVAAGAGGLAGVVVTPDRRRVDDPHAPAELQSAVAAERALIATLDRTAGGSAPATVLGRLRADHVAHLDALRATLADAVYPATPASEHASPQTVRRAVGRSELRTAERAAATAAAHRAARLTGPAAALLASVAACEATHVELLR